MRLAFIFKTNLKTFQKSVALLKKESIINSEDEERKTSLERKRNKK